MNGSRFGFGPRMYAAIGLIVGLFVGLFVLGSGVAAAAPAAGSPPTWPPRLSITVSDGKTEVRSNTDVRYTTTVANQGSAPVTAELVLTTPAYVTIGSAAGAKADAHTAKWRITVRPGRSISRAAEAHIGTIAKGEYRVTALASVYAGKATSGVPLIRSAVANTIAGVTDPARTIKNAPAHAAPKDRSSATDWWLVAGVPGAAVALVALAVLLWWRRRPAEDPSPESMTAAEAAVEQPAGPAAVSLAAPAATGRHQAEDPH